MSARVPCDAAGVTVTVTGELIHRCPFREEVDHGTAAATWTTTTHTVDVHGLREFLNGFSTTPISHEALTSQIAAWLDAAGVSDVCVTTRWRTAGMEVRVAIPRDRVEPGDS